MSKFTLLVTAAMFLCRTAEADMIVSTIPVWNGSASVCCLGGAEGSNAFGETITAPSGSFALTSFTFEIANDHGSNLPFLAYVMSWDGNEATGPILYRSSLQTTGAGTAFASYSFALNVSVTSGKQYIIFASNAETNFAAFPGNYVTGYLGTSAPNNGLDTYAGGGFRFLATGTPMSFWTTTPWSFFSGHAGDDIAFSATFTDVPEAATSILGLVGFGVLGLLAVRKRLA